MKVETLAKEIKKLGIDTLIGVPDSTLKEFCDYIRYEGKNLFTHYVTSNEGAAVGLATGVFLSTGKPACVYMQNSGIGNAVNPITSICNKEVYNIPLLFIVGWRGEPNIKDEPQHRFMGRITKQIFDCLEIDSVVIDNNTTEQELQMIFELVAQKLKENLQFSIIIKRDTFDKKPEKININNYSLIRENVISSILDKIEKDSFIVSTTGKISREVYEQSEAVLGQHSQCFLTVGGMGHASMIALGIAKNKPEQKVYCIDGDGAVLMHMGSLAIIAKIAPYNLIHICLNNDAHESVGGMPTGAVGANFANIAQACGYPLTYVVSTKEELDEAILQAQMRNQLCFIEVKVALYSRSDLGRPKESAEQNKINFMNYHGVN